MSHFTQAQVGQASFSSFSITQSALGSPLEFEPALGSQELDNLINNYIAGNASTQQKRARVVLEFLNSIDAYSYQHPVCLHYYAPLSIASQLPSRQSPVTPPTHKAAKTESANASKNSSSLKRVRQEPSLEDISSAKRLPGFSILTRDGVDITEYASRGPKTKEQRDHAALMRKLKACAACKRSKQRCDPSHHHPTPSALGTSSTYSARNASFSSSLRSRGSISPLSSLGDSFSQSPTQSFATSVVAHTGQRFSSPPNQNLNRSPSDFTLPGTPLVDPVITLSPTQNVDSELFQLADVQDVSLYDYLSQISSDEGIYSSWSSPDNLFAPNYDSEPLAIPNINSMQRNSSGDSSSFVTQQTHENIIGQNYDPQSTLCKTIVSANALEDFDLNDYVPSLLDNESNTRFQPRRRRSLSGEERKNSMSIRTSGACYLCKSRKTTCTHGLPSSTALGSQTGILHGILQGTRHSQAGGSLADSQSQQLQHLGDWQYQDHVLYPDSGDFNMGLEADQIFRDVASTRWPSPHGYLAGLSESQSIDSPLLPRRITSYPTLEAVTTADARYDGQSPTLLEPPHLPDSGRHFSRTSSTSDSEHGYQIASSDGPRLEADGGLSETPMTNIHTHTQSIPLDRSTSSRQCSHRYTARSSQEDDISSNQNASISDDFIHAVVHGAAERGVPDIPADYLENCISQVFPIGEGSIAAATSSLGSTSMNYTISGDSSRCPGQPSIMVEDENEHGPLFGRSQELVQQTDMFVDPQLSTGLVPHVGNGGKDRFKKMNLFVRLCILMAISILATISLLVVGSNYAVDLVSGSFLHEIVSLYCNLPEFQASGTYGALEFIATEPGPWVKCDLHSELGLDATSSSNRHRISYSGHRNFESHDYVDSWPVITATELNAFSADLDYDTSISQLKDTPNEFFDSPRIHGTPTTTLVSFTIMPTTTSVPKPRATNAMQAQSEASLSKGRPLLVQRKPSFLRHSLNRDSILGDITLRMTSLRIG